MTSSSLHALTSHPSDVELLQFVNGTFDDESDFARIETHLNECDRCSERLNALSPELDDELVHLLQVAWQGDTVIASGETMWEQPDPKILPEIDGYELLSEIARGGMGVVYRARHLRLNRTVAIKIILAGAHSGPDDRNRFQREARLVAGLKHPGIVSVYDLGEHSGLPYLAMEYFEAGSLKAHTAGKPQPAWWSAEVVQQVARAVHFAHQRGVIHRDLKPANLLVCPATNSEAVPGVKVTDFGLARQLDSQSVHSLSNSIVGTPFYMAPEQLAGRGEIGPAADVYSLGVILYELLTGRTPFLADGSVETILSALYKNPPSPRSLHSSVPEDLETIALKCLERRPQDRYQSAEDLGDELGRFLRGEPIKAQRYGLLSSVWRSCRRNPRVALLSLAVALSLITGIVITTALAIRANHLAGLAQQRARDIESAQAATRAAWQQTESALYNARIALAQQALKDFDVVAADTLLSECLPSENGSDRRGWEWWYLAAQTDTSFAQLSGFDGVAQAVAFAPDGRLFSVGGGSVFEPGGTQNRGHVLSWVQPWEHEQQIEVPLDDLLVDIALSLDGQSVAVLGRSGDLLVWPSGWDGPTVKIPVKTAPVEMSFSPDGSLLFTFDLENQELTAWKIHPLEIAYQVPAERFVVRTDPPELVTVSDLPEGRRLCRRDLDSGQETESFALQGSATKDPLAAIAGNYFIQAFQNGAEVWDLEEGKRVAVLEDHQNRVTAVALLTNPPRAFTATRGGVIRLWSLPKGEVENVFLGHRGGIRELAVNPDESLLASAGEDGIVRLWNPHDHPEAARFNIGVRRAYFGDATFSQDGETAYIAKSGGPLIHLNLKTGERTENGLEMTTRRVWPRQELVFSRDRTRLITPGLEPQTTAIWNVATGQWMSALPAVDGLLQAADWSNDASRLAVVTHQSVGNGLKSTVSVFHMNPVKRLFHWETSLNANSVALSPTGDRVAIAIADDATLREWNVDSGKPTGQITLDLAPRHFFSFEYSPDGKMLAAADARNDQIVLWRPESEEPATHLKAPRVVCSLAFSPDGRRLAAIGYDSVVSLYDLDLATRLLRLTASDFRPGSAGGTARVAFSPDGRRLLAYTLDDQLTIWTAPD